MTYVVMGIFALVGIAIVLGMVFALCVVAMLVIDSAFRPWMDGAGTVRRITFVEEQEYLTGSDDGGTYRVPAHWSVLVQLDDNLRGWMNYDTMPALQEGQALKVQYRIGRITRDVCDMRPTIS